MSSLRLSGLGSKALPSNLTAEEYKVTVLSLVSSMFCILFIPVNPTNIDCSEQAIPIQPLDNIHTKHL
jgi:hypothetical protein